MRTPGSARRRRNARAPYRTKAHSTIGTTTTMEKIKKEERKQDEEGERETKEENHPAASQDSLLLDHGVETLFKAVPSLHPTLQPARAESP